MEGKHIQEMFQAIAPRYDFLNHFLSLRHDVYWRRVLVKALRVPPEGRVLDVATGTGDVALEIGRQKGSSITVWGIDFAFRMLQLGKKKIAGSKYCVDIRPAQSDAFHPPFKPGAFDALTMAFGIRNIADKKKVLEVFYELLKGGGQILILELTLPKIDFMKNLYFIYFQKVLPMIGKIISGDSGAYSYLPDSVSKFPSPKDFCELMREAGFEKVYYKPLTLGVCTLFTGIK
ncbi:MAG: bifunctional demethylmenaquinone methyltransferase/2-methoxy-6-polyprenyl-1,4-benzoquinol methylase UbiE [Pseudomonadota bacterium]